MKYLIYFFAVIDIIISIIFFLLSTRTLRLINYYQLVLTRYIALVYVEFAV